MLKFKEFVTELSKGTLTRYTTKAKKEADYHWDKALTAWNIKKDKTANVHADITHKREKGIALANAKINAPKVGASEGGNFVRRKNR